MTGSPERRRVLVTGGTGGIGRAIVGAFLAEGADVFACARRAPEAPLGPGVRFMLADVADATSVAALFQQIGTTHARLDVLVNNAGTAGANRLDGDDALWHDIMATNLDGTYHCCKAALPLLPDVTGRIVNIASVLGWRGIADQTAYSAAKHGVIGFTRSLALALAPRRITVNAACPGWVDTEMARQRFAALGIDAGAAARQTPTGRITSAEEVAALVLFLASPDAGNITGQAIAVDGGWLA